MLDLLAQFLRRLLECRATGRRRHSRGNLYRPLPCSRFVQSLEFRTLLSAVGAEKSTYVVLFDDEGLQADEHTNFLSNVERALGEKIEVQFEFQHALNGTALLLTSQQATQVADMPTVSLVLKDAASKLLENSAVLTGAPGLWDGSAIGRDATGTLGEGVLIGIIDSGIDVDNPSFAAVGVNDDYVHVNPFGDGVYVGLGDPVNSDYDSSLPFNSKVVGAWNYTSDPIQSAGDADHGTSVAGIAAGNFVTVPIPGSSDTTEISGVAPHANIISYDVCTTLDDCSNAAIMAAIDQAIADGVDVINLSIGGPTENPWDAVMASALLKAHAAGIFVAVSAGNEGPGAATLTAPADAPWVASVASVGVEDVTATSVTVIAEDVPPSIAAIRATPGENVTIPQDIGPAPVIHAADVSPGDAQGSSPYFADTFSGAIALIDRGESLFETKVQHAFDAGAVAVIMINNIDGPNIIMAGVGGVSIPSVLISREDGDALRTWLRENPDATVQLNAAATQELTIVSSFSSRGENTQADTLAPAIAAPGADNLILAPVADFNTDRWEFFSGTSAASPHIAGAAALLVSLHPNWSPSELQSALQTTAISSSQIVDDFSGTPADPFDVGSGLVDVSRAALAGLVLDEAAVNFTAADPSRGGQPEELNLASFVDSGVHDSTAWTRTITSTQLSTVVWTPTFVADDGLSLSLDRNEITLGPAASADIMLTADVTGVVSGWLFGQLILTPDIDLPVAKFPVAVDVPKPVGVTILESGSGTDVSEYGAVDTYEILFDTTPSQSVTVKVEAPAGVEVSSDGATFESSLMLMFSDQTSQTITVRAMDDNLPEGRQSLAITHAVINPTAGADYTTATNVANLVVSVFDSDAGRSGDLSVSEITEPLGTLDTVRPAFSWTPAEGAESYSVLVFRSTDTATPVWSFETSVTSAVSPFDLEIGQYNFTVAAIFPGGAESTSAAATFVVNTSPDLSPLPFYADAAQPTFSWTDVPGAATHQVYLANATTRQNPLINERDIHATAYTPATELEFGLHCFWVRAIAADGFEGKWSEPILYYVGSQLLGPVRPTFQTQPTFRWTEPAGAESYEFYLRAPDGTITNPRGLADAAFTPTNPLANGRYSWWIRPYTAEGHAGEWSERGEVNIGGRPNVLAPATDANAAAPEFQWTSVEGAASYEVFLNRTDITQHVLRTTQLPNSTFVPPILAPGNYELWVRAKDSAGYAGPWSSRHRFSVAAAVAGVTATPVERHQTSLLQTPTLLWQHSADAVAFDVHLFDGRSVIRAQQLTAASWQTPNLGSAKWKWWVRAITADGHAGPWSSEATIDTTGRAATVSPIGMADPNPIFNWTAVLEADRYVLQVNNLTTGEAQFIREDDLRETSFQSSGPLPSGSYRFWVRAISDANPAAGFWSFPADFEIA